jgi:hypothetical protein
MLSCSSALTEIELLLSGHFGISECGALRGPILVAGGQQDHLLYIASILVLAESTCGYESFARRGFVWVLIHVVILVLILILGRGNHNGFFKLFGRAQEAVSFQV